MNKPINWHITLDELASMDMQDKHYETLSYKAETAAREWGSCAVAEKILTIHDGWEHLTTESREHILERYPKLYRMGMEFMRDVQAHDYFTAIELHQAILDHKINKQSLQNRIDEHL